MIIYQFIIVLKNITSTEASKSIEKFIPSEVVIKEKNFFLAKLWPLKGYHDTISLFAVYVIETATAIDFSCIKKNIIKNVNSVLLMEVIKIKDMNFLIKNII